MPNNNNGRTGNRADENRPSWRPQDQHREVNRDRGSEDHWRGSEEDRLERADRNVGDRQQTERQGQGQSGYGAGRYSEDRAYHTRNQSGPSRDGQGMGLDDRFERGRGGGDFGNERGMGGGASSGYHPERQGVQGGYAGGRGFEDRWGSQQPDMERNQRGPQGPQGGGPYGGGQGARGQGPVGQAPGAHRGKGPQGFTRSDDRIKEYVCEALTDDEHLDATHVEVVVKNGDVMLTGAVEDRAAKRMAEEIAERQPGVKDVQNQLRVGGQHQQGNRTSGSAVGRNETETSQPESPKQETETSGGTLSSDKKHRA